MLEWAAQRDCGCLIPGGVQGQVGWERWAASSSVKCGGLWPYLELGDWSVMIHEVPSKLSHSMILRFYDILPMIQTRWEARQMIFC